MRPAVVGVVVGTITVLIGLVAAFVILDNERKDERARETDRTTNVVSLWQEKISQQLFAVVSTAYSLGGFATSSFVTIPPHADTNKTHRMQFLAPARFDIFCADLKADVPGLLALQLQSSGVITQAYPTGTSPIGLDILNHPTQSGDVYRAIDAKGVVVAGPLDLVQGGKGIIVRYPIFDTADDSKKNMNTWWGLSAVVMRMKEFLADIGIEAGMTAQGQDYVLTFTNASGSLIIMGNSTGANVAHLSSEGVQRKITLPNGNFWTLAVAPRSGFTTAMRPEGIALGVCIPLLVAIVCAAAASAGYGHILALQRSTKNAPTEPPMVLIFTDIESSTQLWAEAPDEMPDVIVKHGDLIRAVIASYGGYEVKTIGDSFMIAVGTVDAALGIATDIQKALMGATWPPTVTHFNGDGYLRVRIGVHYCTDIAATFDEVSKGYDYFGNDVNYAARLESTAVGAEVLVSKPLRDHVESDSKLRLKFTFEEMGAAVFKGIADPQPVYRLPVEGQPRRRERIDPVEGDTHSEQDTNSPRESLHSTMSARYRPNQQGGAGEDLESVMQLLSNLNGAAAGSDATEQNALETLCVSYLYGFSTLLGALRGKDRNTVPQKISASLGLPNDRQLIARLAVRCGTINLKKYGTHAAPQLAHSPNSEKKSFHVIPSQDSFKMYAASV